MEVKPAQADRFVKAPPAELRALLLYGPDGGLVRERAEAAVKAAAGSLDDPFRVVELTGAQISADPARLADEAAALSFGGGQRAVWVRDAGDSLLTRLKAFFKDMPGEALIVIEAGELPKRSALVQLFEGHKQAAAVACYRDEGRNLEQLIVETLAQEGLSATRDALAFLSANLGGDRRLTRRELEKLALQARGQEGPIDVADAAASIGDTAALSLDDLVFAIADGRVAEADRVIQRNFQEGTSPVALLRAVARHFERLHLAGLAAAANGDLDGALRRLRPPVFWKNADRFKAQVRNWPPALLGRAQRRLLETEMACKRTGAPDTTLCAETLLRIAAGSPLRRLNRRPA